MNLILFGPPGAGKGTQGDTISKEFDLFKVSTGDLLRKEISKKTELGNKIKEDMDNGNLVPDNIINDLIENVLSKKNLFNRLLFDGYPRNLSQARQFEKLLNKYNQVLSSVLILMVDKNIITKRILGRQVCSKCGSTFNKFFNPSTKKNHSCESNFLQRRSDDNEKTIESRFKTYMNDTLPILNYYRNQDLVHEIDAKGNISEIYAQIRRLISSLNT